MARTGRPPIPKKLHEARGNPSKKSLNYSEPEPPPGLPVPPPVLKNEALSKWHEMVDLLTEMEILTKADGDVLARYCEAWRIWVKANVHIERHGTVLKTTNGNMQLNPMIYERNHAEKTMEKSGSEMGLTPAARARLRIEGSGKKDREKEDRRKRFFGKERIRRVK